MTIRNTLALVGLLGATTLIHAAPAAGQEPALEPGDSTRAWLHMQRNNVQAAPNKGMLGSASTLAYQRYLESFKHKVPDHYFTNSELFKSSGK